MILIADSSALIALAICDGLQHLEPLYGDDLIRPAAPDTDWTALK